MKNPFTHAPGRVGDANIERDKELEIYNNFEYDVPSEAVYKIIGIRGSGKTVILGNILRHYRNEEMKNKNSYQVNSNSLKKQGLLEDSAASYGVAEITLPFFGEYIEKYVME